MLSYLVDERVRVVCRRSLAYLAVGSHRYSVSYSAAVYATPASPLDPVAEFSRTLDQGVSADHARLHSSRLTGLRVPYDYGSYLPGYLVAAGRQLDWCRVL
jgi:hypothetical protein